MFQLVVLGVFFIFFLGGILVVAIYSSRGSQNAIQPISVVVWGSLNGGQMRQAIERLESERKIQITYVQKNESVFDSGLAEAIVTGEGPDIILLRQDALPANIQKISYVPYDLYSRREFQDTFVESGEIFLSSLGAYAIPFVIDPLVMYWNRDLFSQKALTNPPQYWDEVFALAGQLTTFDANGGVLQSAVALGAYDNVKNAKEIISTLFLQGGISITEWNQARTVVTSSLSRDLYAAADALSFYMQFADARKSVRSWTRALPDSETMFLSNRLAVYFGFASEVNGLQSRSPNLNFDVALIPQSRSKAPESVTLGRTYAFAVLNSAEDKLGAFEAVKALTSKGVVEQFSSISGIPPARRDISAPSGDPFQSVFYRSSIISEAWLDPRRDETGFIFKDMIDSVASGFSTPLDAVGKAEQQLRFVNQ